VEIVYYAPQKKLDNEGELELLLPKLDIPITTFTLQLNLPSTYIFHKFEGSDLQRKESHTCHLPGEPSQRPMPPPLSHDFGVNEKMVRMKKADVYVQQSMMAETSYGGAYPASRSQAPAAATFDLSTAASGNLDSGVLPVKVSPLQLGDKYCFERMLVHEKTFLSIRASYISKEYRSQSWAWQIRTVLEFISSNFLLLAFALMLTIPVVFLLFRVRSFLMNTGKKGA